ncbi:MAG: sigma-70 family RNA polymerase sigma factor [Myxococcota bacterium]
MDNLTTEPEVQKTAKSRDSRRFGPLKPAGIRLARVLGTLKQTAPDRSPIYRAEGETPVNEEPPNRTTSRHARAAFEAIVSPHMDELYGAALKLTRSETDADDVLQESMARAWTFWDRFEPGTNVRAWMHRIVYNTFVNGYRKRRREREILERVHQSGRALRAESAEPYMDGLGDEVRAALQDLPHNFRAVVERVDLRGESYRDCADALGCPVGTVMSRLHRGRRLLQSKLRSYATLEGYVAAA